MARSPSPTSSWLEIGRSAGELVLQPAGERFYDDRLAVQALRRAHEDRPFVSRGLAPTYAPTCPDCGGLMRRIGTCHTCPSCGASDGCA